MQVAFAEAQHAYSAVLPPDPCIRDGSEAVMPTLPVRGLVGARMGKRSAHAQPYGESSP